MSRGLRNEKSQARAFWAEGTACTKALRHDQMWIAQRPVREPGWLDWGEPGKHGWRGTVVTVKSQTAMGTDLQFVL